MTGAIKGSGGAAYRTTKDVAEKATSVARQVPSRVGADRAPARSRRRFSARSSPELGRFMLIVSKIIGERYRQEAYPSGSGTAHIW